MAAVLVACFALWERRSTHPMLDVSVFFNRRFSGGSLAVTAGFLTLFGFIFVITQYFQFIKEYSAFRDRSAVAASCRIDRTGQRPGPPLVERVGTTAVVAAGLAVFAAGLSWASTADAATPYTEIAMQMVLLGGGLGLTTAPATEAIMGSLSADKAGVGSAVNDTTRELGGTLGVAIVGSIFASVYSGHLGSTSALEGLPGDAMQHSMALAHKVIQQLPARRAGYVRDAVDHAFLDGLQVSTLVCAGIALGAAIVVGWLLPSWEPGASAWKSALVKGRLNDTDPSPVLDRAVATQHRAGPDHRREGPRPPCARRPRASWRTSTPWAATPPPS